MFWVHLGGQHPQTGQPVDQFDCSFKWMPVMLLEGAKRTMGVQAAIESTRNEIITRQDQLNNAVALGQRQAAKQIGEQEWNSQPERLPKAT